MSKEIEVHSDYGSVGKFFQLEPVYRIPKYQRSYSWEQSEIEDFLRDLTKCFKERQMSSDSENHFFGQIVCISSVLWGTEDKKVLEIVDGQQRISTFILLAAAIIQCCKALIVTLQGDMTKNDQISILEKRIKDLKARFINFQFEVNTVIEQVNVLELSKHDNPYFNGLLDDPTLQSRCASNERLKYAFQRIYELTDQLTKSSQLNDHIGNLKTMEKVLLEDFFILKMVTSDAKAAFKLFQVLNNRGKNLTEGDLFRAESLRVLENYPTEQALAEEYWDGILIDHPAKTANFLKAIYSSYSGNASDTNTLFIELLNKFLPEHEYTIIDAHHAISVITKIKQMETDIVTLRKLSEGQWPFVHQKPIEYWDRNRLYLLIEGLGHKECLPFLLSAQLLGHKEFNKIVQVLEIFVFRYLTVCKLFVGDLVKIYNTEAALLRSNPSDYNATKLITALQPLQEQANYEMFRRQLDDLKYYRLGKSNKPVKYFLLCMEYFYQWYKDGAQGNLANNKEKVHDFNDISIEHIYPHAAAGAIVDQQLEPYKNNIGNLTLLGNEDNKTGDNDDFVTKKPIYERSSLLINSDWLASYTTWTLTDLQDRTEKLKDMACKIFKI